MIKDALVRESFRLGYLTEKSAKEMVKIGTIDDLSFVFPFLMARLLSGFFLSLDVTKTGHIFNFFVSCGWVRTEPSTPKGMTSVRYE